MIIQMEQMNKDNSDNYPAYLGRNIRDDVSLLFEGKRQIVNWLFVNRQLANH